MRFLLFDYLNIHVSDALCVVYCILLRVIFVMFRNILGTTEWEYLLGRMQFFFFLLFIVLLDNFLFIILFLVFISMFNMCLRVRSWFVNFSYYLVNLFSYLLVWIHLFFLFISFLIATVLCSSTDEYRKKQREYLTNDQVRKKLKTWTLIFKK